MNNTEKSLFAAAAALILYDLYQKSKPAHIGAVYPQQDEVIISSMIGQIEEHYFVFPDDNMTAQERRKLLKDSLKFEKSSIQMFFQYKGKKSDAWKVGSSKDAFQYLQKTVDKSRLDSQEMFIVLYLNQANAVIGHDVLSYGGLTGTVADIRLIIQKAVLMLAPGIIISHNHPSGTPKPSGADRELTKRLKDALKLLDITLLDHIIIADEPNGDYYSFADDGMI